MYCKIILMGRLTANPEIRHTASNIPVTSFSIAVNRPFTSKDGERLTDFFNVVAWRAQAEFICKYFKKGNCILIDGRVENREYVDRNGNKQRVTEVIAENVSFTGEPKGSSYGSEPYSNNENNVNDNLNSNSGNAFENLNPGSFEEIDGDDDLPF